MPDNSIEVIMPVSQDGFVETPYIKSLKERALRYLGLNYPIHLSGPTGCGKTILALHLANSLGRPMVLINGDEEVGNRSFIGGEHGYRKKLLVDRFISRVLKQEESMTKTWQDERLTTACKYGFTLVYNEFTRSKPEVNNVLLPVLEERILALPSGAFGEDYIKVHENFSAIFTSNPEEYVGVYRSQDALLDRMITLNLAHYDEESEIAITVARSGLEQEKVKRIVNLVRRLRESGFCESIPTVRACIMVAKVIKQMDSDLSNKIFYETCCDVLLPKIGKKDRSNDPKIILDEILAAEGLHYLSTTKATAKKERVLDIDRGIDREMISKLESYK